MTKKSLPSRWVVFDVGGTSLRAARFDPTKDSVGDILVEESPSFQAHRGSSPEELQSRLFARMDAMASHVLNGEKPDVVSVGFPGPIDPEGNALAAPTVLGVTPGPTPVGKRLAAIWPQAHIVVINDVTAAGYYALKRPDETFCIVTVSSGIGDKVFVDGEPVVGPGGRGGELGHLVVDPSPTAPICDCGGRGHLGGIASGRGTLAAVKRAAESDRAGFAASALGVASDTTVEKINNEAIVAAFRAGDPWTTARVTFCAAFLARALAGIHCAIGVERFVVMGGFGLAMGEGYRRLLARLCADSCWNLGQNWNTMIELAQPGEVAPLVGAGRAALAEWNKKHA